jgi:hypothetical protein
VADNIKMGSPEWWRRFLIKELMSSQQRFELLDDYASGNHPVPTADRRYFKALKEVQRKARTNYYGMITKAPIERMRVKGFRFGEDGSADDTAKMIWSFNDMDYQSQYLFANGATFGRSYLLISPPEEGKEVLVPDTSDKAKQFAEDQAKKPDPKQKEPVAPKKPTDQDSEEKPKPDDKDDLNKKFPVSKAGEDFKFPDREDPDKPKMTKKALPVMTWEDPRMCITFQDPIHPTRSLAGLKLWMDVVTGKVLCILFLPDKIYWYEGPKTSDIEGMPLDKLEHTLSSAEGTFKLVRTEKNEIEEVPLVYIEWRPEALAECEDLLDVQDRINLTILHRLVITQNQSFRQRWMSGASPAKGSKKGAQKPAFDPGADMLWVTDNPDAKFGDFAQADIRQVLEAIRDDIADMAALSKTPVHYLMGKLANVSGDTLTQGESGFVSKIKMRMASVGWGLEKAMKIAFKYIDESEKAEQVDAEVIWADPEVRTRAEIADAAVKEAQVLAEAPPYALALVLKRMGFDPDEIKFAMAERERFEQEQRAREEQLLAQQHENMKEAGMQQQDGQMQMQEKQLGTQADIASKQMQTQQKIASMSNKPRPGSGGPAAKKKKPNS